MPTEIELITEDGEPIGKTELSDEMHERLHAFAEEYDLTFDQAFNVFVRIGMNLEQGSG